MADDIPIIKAALEGNVEYAKQYIASGGDLEAEGPETSKHSLKGVTPLIAAIGAKKSTSNHTEIVKLLLDNGANQNVKLEHYNTNALHNLLMNGLINVEILKLLIKHGTDINLRSSYGATPLDSFSNVHQRRMNPLILPILKANGFKTGEQLIALEKRRKRINALKTYFKKLSNIFSRGR